MSCFLAPPGPFFFIRKPFLKTFSLNSWGPVYRCLLIGSKISGVYSLGDVYSWPKSYSGFLKPYSRNRVPKRPRVCRGPKPYSPARETEKNYTPGGITLRYA